MHEKEKQNAAAVSKLSKVQLRNEINLFNEVSQEFEAIAGIVELSGTWEEVQ